MAVTLNTSSELFDLTQIQLYIYQAFNRYPLQSRCSCALQCQLTKKLNFYLKRNFVNICCKNDLSNKIKKENLLYLCSHCC